MQRAGAKPALSFHRSFQHAERTGRALAAAERLWLIAYDVKGDAIRAESFARVAESGDAHAREPLATDGFPDAPSVR